MRSSSDLAASTSLIHCNARVGFYAFEQTAVQKVHNPALKFCIVEELSQMHLRGRMTRIYHATLSTCPDTHGMVSHGLKTIAVVQTLSCALQRKEGKCVVCNGFSLPLFSIPSLLLIPDDVAKFLESVCSSSGTRRAD